MNFLVPTLKYNVNISTDKKKTIRIRSQLAGFGSCSTQKHYFNKRLYTALKYKKNNLIFIHKKYICINLAYTKRVSFF